MKTHGEQGGRGAAKERSLVGLPIDNRRLAVTPPAERPTQKASVEVARRIVDDLVEHYRVGDRLPSEADMIQLYSVSRETLREAIRLLEVQGLLSIRRGPGGGPRVTAVNPAYLARAASLYFHVVGATYGEVFDAWAALEPTMVGRVAAHPDRDAVAAAMAPYLTTTTSTDPQAAIERSATLHSEIGRLSGNRVLMLLLQSIAHILTELMLEAVDLGGTKEEIQHDHRALALAIMSGDAHEAERLARAHILHMQDELDKIVHRRMEDVVEWR